MKCSEHKSCVASNATAVFSRSQGLKNLTARLRTTDKLFATFVYDILTYDPAERLDPAKALRHPFMAKVHLLLSPMAPCFSLRLCLHHMRRCEPYGGMGFRIP